MSAQTVDQALEGIYESLANDNDKLDQRIDTLKAAMQKQGLKEVALAPDRLYQNNRAGRKLLQSYFKRRGVKVAFKDS